MQRLEVSGAVRPIYGSLGVKRLRTFAGQTTDVIVLSQLTHPNFGKVQSRFLKFLTIKAYFQLTKASAHQLKLLF